MAVVISGNGIDMGGNPVSNVTVNSNVDVADKDYVDDSINLNSTILQVVYAENKVVGSGSLTFPINGTIPQITEGNEILTCTITPKKVNSRLLIEFTPSCQEVSNTGNTLVVACFINGVSNALYQNATHVSSPTTLTENNITGRFIIDTPTTSNITFSLKAGLKGGSIRWNQIKHNSESETTNTSTTMTITEIAQ